jgi:hypothetical protein
MSTYSGATTEVERDRNEQRQQDRKRNPECECRVAIKAGVPGPDQTLTERTQKITDIGNSDGREIANGLKYGRKRRDFEIRVLCAVCPANRRIADEGDDTGTDQPEIISEPMA